ncbi:MAG TPA: DUF5681 domain-containing protein [Xanthobacteraceae bacterium]|nr:DUF5681 domain-containing protein [Xanthobacteraceae bacterium]
MPFAKGQSGNPAGRPVGSRNRFTREMQDALESRGLPLIQLLVEEAIDGNSAAMRQCLDRILGKHRPSSVALPAPDSPNYVVAALTEIHRALGTGEIASDEAARLVDFVGRTARVLASKAVAEIDFTERLARCEEALLLLLNASKPTMELPIDNNNAETMNPARVEPTGTARAAQGEAAPVANNDENRLVNAAMEAARAEVPNPPALTAAEVTEKATPAVPPEIPTAAAA